jgi:GT2 family glycosyltransferase
MPTEPSLTVAILTYDGIRLLDIVLPSLAAQRFRDFRTVVVDNGSSDGTGAWLREHWPAVEVVSLPENVGVTVALNVCVDAGAGSEFVCLLNNDLELDPDCLGELVAALRRDPQAGSASAKMLNYRDRGVIDGAGDIFIWQGLPIRRGHGEPDRGQYDEAKVIFAACGATVIYRRAALESVGPFDERFFAIYEDSDWCFRAQLAGWGCRYVPSAVSYHMGSETLGRDLSDFTRFHLWRNGIWLVAKNYPAWALVREAPRLVFAQSRNLREAIQERRLGVWRRAIVAAACGLPDVLRSRRQVQRERRASQRDLDAIVGFDP